MRIDNAPKTFHDYNNDDVSAKFFVYLITVFTSIIYKNCNLHRWNSILVAKFRLIELEWWQSFEGEKNVTGTGIHGKKVDPIILNPVVAEQFSIFT